MAQSRAEREAIFKAKRGVASGTYYEMRTKATKAGISPKTFDALADKRDYTTAKNIAIQARTDLDVARFNALNVLGVVPRDMALSDLAATIDYDLLSAAFEWWYH